MRGWVWMQSGEIQDGDPGDEGNQKFYDRQHYIFYHDFYDSLHCFPGIGS